jgi:hypothetical protein
MGPKEIRPNPKIPWFKRNWEPVAQLWDFSIPGKKRSTMGVP